MSLKNTALLLCDLQKQTINNLYYKKSVINNINKLLFMKKYIPQISFCAISEFIPNKLGKTDVENVDVENIDLIYEKTTYSMINDLLVKSLDINNINTVILTGMETQWCINRTSEELKNLNYNIYIPIDAIGNNLTHEANKFNIENLKNNGAFLTTTDAIICKYLFNYDDIASKKYLEFINNNRFE